MHGRLAVLAHVAQAAGGIVLVVKHRRLAFDGLGLLADAAQGIALILDREDFPDVERGRQAFPLAETGVSLRRGDLAQLRPGDRSISGVTLQGKRARLSKQSIGIVLKTAGLTAIQSQRREAEIMIIDATDLSANQADPGSLGQQRAVIFVGYGAAIRGGGGH